MDLSLRPMRYPQFYDRFRDAIKNTWTVEEVDLHSDLGDLGKLRIPGRRHRRGLLGQIVTTERDGRVIRYRLASDAHAALLACP